MEGLEAIFRWMHVFVGIIWIGHLYFFNWVNGPFTAKLDPPTRKAVVPELMPRAPLGSSLYVDHGCTPLAFGLLPWTTSSRRRSGVVRGCDHHDRRDLPCRLRLRHAME